MHRLSSSNTGSSPTDAYNLAMDKSARRAVPAAKRLAISDPDIWICINAYLFILVKYCNITPHIRYFSAWLPSLRTKSSRLMADYMNHSVLPLSVFGRVRVRVLAGRTQVSPFSLARTVSVTTAAHAQSVAHLRLIVLAH